MGILGRLGEFGKEIASWDREPISKEESQAKGAAFEERARQARLETEELKPRYTFKEYRRLPLFGEEGDEGIRLERIKVESKEERQKWPWEGNLTHDIMGDFKRLYPQILMEEGNQTAIMFAIGTVLRLKRQGVREEDARRKVQNSINRMRAEGTIS